MAQSWPPRRQPEGAATARPGRLKSGKQDVSNALEFALLTFRQMLQLRYHKLHYCGFAHATRTSSAAYV